MEYLTKAIGFSVESLFGAKKKGIWLTVEPNIGFKFATLTKEGEKYLEKYEIQIIFREQNQ